MKDKSNHLQMLFYTDLIEYNPPPFTLTRGSQDNIRSKLRS